jgi:hypothetical protein
MYCHCCSCAKHGADFFAQAVVVTLPTIESSFVNHVGKGIQGFDHPDYPALRVAAEVLSATESFLWVNNCPPSIPYGSLNTFPAIHPRLWASVWCLCRD